MTFDDLAAGDVMYQASKRANGGAHINYEEITEIGDPMFGKRKLTVKDRETEKKRTYELGSMIRYHEISGGPKMATAHLLKPDRLGRLIWNGQ